jgi:hypothetical protein
MNARARTDVCIGCYLELRHLVRCKWKKSIVNSYSNGYVYDLLLPLVSLPSVSWNKAPIWGLRPDCYHCQLRVCCCGALSLRRVRVCRLQLLLALASAFIFRSESRGTRHHILLSQIRDFSFCRLLRPARLLWKFSTPPPLGIRRFVATY